MKRNSIFFQLMVDKFSDYIQSCNLKRKLVPIYCVSAFIFLIILILGPSPTAGDTSTNFSAASVLASGKLDALRTPLYPLLINSFRLITSNNITIKLGIILFQYLVFCISIFCFYRVCTYFIKSNGIAFFVVMCYACHPAILVWQKIIMTESLALSGIVFFLYFIIRFLVTRKILYSLLVNLFVFLLIMLRPGFLFLIPIVFAFWLYFIFKVKKNGLPGFTGIVFVIILIGGYSGIFQKQYGVYTLSTVSDINQYMMLRDAGLIETSSIKDVVFKKTLTEVIQKRKTDSEYFDEFIFFYSKYGVTTTNSFVKKSILINCPKYVAYNVNRFVRETTESGVGFWKGFNHNKYNPLIRLICFPFILLFVFLILYLYILIKNKFTFKSSFFIYTIALSSIFVFIVGAPNAWGRLIVPTIPILLIMFGQCFDIIQLKLNYQNPSFNL